MDDDVLFSIIVPIYGVEQYLTICVNSILSQTYSNIEVILVDDGSEDECPQMCDEFAEIDCRVKVIHKQNGGLVSARQAGVSTASGEYIVCIDGDDWIKSDYIEHFYKIAQTFNPDVIVCGTVYSWSEARKIRKPNLDFGFYDKEKLEKIIFPRLIYSKTGQNQFPGQLWAKAFRKQIYQQQQQLVNVKLNMGEDRACSLPTVFHSSSLYVSDYCGYYYRQVITSMTKRKKPFNIDGPEIIHNHLRKQMDFSKYDLGEQMDRGTTHSLFNVCKSQFYSGDSYFAVCNRISSILDKPLYNEVIHRATFVHSLSRSLMLYALKYRLYFLLYLYSKLS